MIKSNIKLLKQFNFLYAIYLQGMGMVNIMAKLIMISNLLVTLDAGTEISNMVRVNFFIWMEEYLLVNF